MHTTLTLGVPSLWKRSGMRFKPVLLLRVLSFG